MFSSKRPNEKTYQDQNGISSSLQLVYDIKTLRKAKKDYYPDTNLLNFVKLLMMQVLKSLIMRRCHETVEELRVSTLLYSQILRAVAKNYCEKRQTFSIRQCQSFVPFEKINVIPQKFFQFKVQAQGT